jgi:hypothetical protein
MLRSTSFIKLTSVIINKAHIVEIVKKPTQYHIYMSNNVTDGCWILAFGIIKTHYNVIEICSVKQPIDFKKITEWIDTVE